MIDYNAITEKNVDEYIEGIISKNDIVLFMKGTQDKPMCGFSATLVNILMQVKVDFVDINVLENNCLRQGIKDFSNWLTVPQLYVRGKFIGGCDIVHDMHEKGELQKLLVNKEG